MSLTAKAQRSLLRHYTVQDGLPSNTIYDISQDSKGFIWFSTDQGVSRFDGRAFRNLSIRDGLPDNEVFSVTEDEYQRHWLVCYNNRACYLKDGKVYTSKNDALCRQIEQAHIQYTSLSRDKKGQTCLVGKRIASVAKDQINLKEMVADPGEVFNGIFTHGGREYFISNLQICWYDRGLRRSLIKAQMKAIAVRGDNILLFRFDSRIPTLEQWRFEGNEIALNTRMHPKDRVYHLVSTKDHFVACTDAGAHTYNPTTGSYKEGDDLPPNTCNNRWMQDVEGNEWFATTNNGVYMQLWTKPRIFDNRSGLANNNILALQPTPYGELLAGSDQGDISVIGGRSVFNFMPTKLGYTSRIRFLFSVGRNEVMSGSDGGVNRFNTLNGQCRTVFVDAVKAGVMKKDHCLFASFGIAIRYDVNSGAMSEYWRHLTTAIEESDDGVVWLGTLDGLYIKPKASSTIHPYTGYPELLHQRITALVLTKAGNLAIGTSTSGLFIRSNDTVIHLSEKEGLSSNSCRKITVDSTGNLWLCSDKGLDKINLKNFPQYEINTHVLSDGLPVNKLNDVAIFGGQLYLATSEGVVVLDNRLRQQLDARVPRLHITAVGNDDIPNEQNPGMVVRDYDRNSLQVSYTGISFAGARDVEYKYFLEGSSSDTVLTKDQTINFSTLSPGDYRLIIWARNRTGPWTTMPSALTFRILAPWWRTPVFIAITAMLLLASAYLIYRWRIRLIQIKAERKVATNRQMAELEMKALRAQINPHFIFNALNSIQTYYANNDELRANHYMSAFAQFVRKTLTHSQSHWLPLSEELSMLRTYVELEQMRFKQAFTFELLIDQHIQAEHIVLPAMLIQPYVENAINHGLRHLKDRQGALVISFILQEHSLVCTIDDNGIGFLAAQQNKKENHQSFGMHINRQRIHTINQLYHTSIEMKVIDKKSVAPLSNGTVIEVNIPLKLNAQYAEYTDS